MTLAWWDAFPEPDTFYFLLSTVTFLSLESCSSELKAARICMRSAVPAAMHADRLLTIHTLNRVVDSKVSSWDPKMAADLVNSMRAVSESGCHLA
jgi:hypothetical protein